MLSGTAKNSIGKSRGSTFPCPSIRGAYEDGIARNALGRSVRVEVDRVDARSKVWCERAEAELDVE
jgi:hypothetical protein